MLSKVDLFVDLPADMLEQLQRYCSKRSYPKNSVVVAESQPSYEFFIILSGRVKVYVSKNDGKQLILNNLDVGDYFGELGLIDGSARSASVMTLEDTELMVISQRDFHEFMQMDSAIPINLMKAMTRRIRTLTDSVSDLALLGVYGRVANLLQNRVSDPNGCISPKPTHQEIADRVGASREMVSRIMRELFIGGYLEQTSKELRLLKAFPKGW